MSAEDQIIKINISQQTQAVPQVSFSIPLIIGPTTPTSGTTNAYADPSELLANGYTTSSPEYIYALELFEQPLSPTEFVVGQRLAAVEQVDTFAVGTLVASHNYNFELNATLIAYTSNGGDTQQSILTALNAAITAAFPTNPPVAGVVSGSGPGALLTLTSTVAGQGISYAAIDSDLTHVPVTPNHGIADDLTAIIAINNDWYGVALCSNLKSDIEQLAAAIEALKKIYIPVSKDTDVPTNVSTDVASVLKLKAYKRSALIYTPTSYNQGVDAAWLGLNLPQTPGSNNWAYDSLNGITVDTNLTISDTQALILIGNPVAALPGKNANIYRIVGGKNITQMGTMAGGQYIDITVGLDWLESTLQANIFQALTSSAKIPYTDKGTGILLSAVKAAIDQGVVNGLIDGNSPITITAPPVLSVPVSQRANRIAPTITFSCRLQGAFNAVVVNGTVTV